MIIKEKMVQIANEIKCNKKIFWTYLFVCICLIIGIIMVFHNYQWYEESIAKIIHVENSFEDEVEGYHGEKENYYEQTLIGTMMNGKYEGNKITMENTYSSSKVHHEEYKVGDDVFVQLKSNGDQLRNASIIGLKRDKYLAILFAILILIILITARKKGIFVILSLLTNILIFGYALDLYVKGSNILFLSNAMVLCFTFLSLLLVSGFKKKTLVAILSTLVSVWIMMFLLKLAIRYTDGVDYTFMEYITSGSDLTEIFLSQILLGGLGAIMDVSITIASTMSELIHKDHTIALNNLVKSGRELGHDIMGTMINVMLFTYICGAIPLIVLKMKNDISLHTIILIHMPFEVYRFLIGSIGILSTIPISLLISFVLLKKWRRTV